MVNNHSAFGNLPIKPLYNKRSFVFSLGYDDYLTMFSFFTSKVWKLRRSKNLSLTDFNLILNSLIYIRLNPDDVSMTPKIVSVFKTFGVPPRLFQVIRLLPKQGDRSFYAGRINFQFLYSPSPEALQDAMMNITIVLNGVHSEMESYDSYFSKCDHHTEIMSFFRPVEDALQFSLSLPGQTVKLCDSTCFTILFGLRAACTVDEQYEYDLVFKQLYSSDFGKVDLQELERLALDNIFTEDKITNVSKSFDLPERSSSRSHGLDVNTSSSRQQTSFNELGKRKFSSAIVGRRTIFILDKNGDFLKEYLISETTQT